MDAASLALVNVGGTVTVAEKDATVVTKLLKVPTTLPLGLFEVEVRDVVGAIGGWVVVGCEAPALVEVAWPVPGFDPDVTASAAALLAVVPES